MPETPDSQKSTQEHAKTMLMAAWRSWLLCVAAPGIWLVYVVVKLPPKAENLIAGPESSIFGPGNGMAFLAVAWLALAGPAAFVLRSYCFRATWDGRSVDPDSYLKGMGTIWAVLVVGAVLALFGCVLAGQWLPGLAVAGVAVAGVLVTRPNKQALGLGQPAVPPTSPTQA
ncbi:hypothetical protein OT109_08075 [Phycisphaeraceae bacterium D3-23]